MPRKTASSAKADIFAPRLKRLRNSLPEHKIDSLLVTNPADIRYLTGFRGEDAYLLVALKGKARLISDSRFETELRSLKKRLSIIIRTGPMIPAVVNLADKISLTCMGVQAEYLTVSVRSQLQRKLGAKRLRNTEGLIRNLRVIKDEAELKLLRKAGQIQQKALDLTLKTVKAGQTETEVAARLAYEMRNLGADGEAFPSIVAARANGALPHAVPGRTRLAAGQPLLIDWGASYQGYRSDMTRTFTLGRWSAKMREIYGIVVESQLAGIAAVQPGARCADVDKASREVIEAAGYGKLFGHGLGHGIGLDVHEAPGLNRRSNEVLQPGMVVTIEPGIYIPGTGGVRIEDDVLVTDRDHKVLTNYPKDIESMVI